MIYSISQEQNPTWNPTKSGLFSQAPPGTFTSLPSAAEFGNLLPDDWWLATPAGGGNAVGVAGFYDYGNVWHAVVAVDADHQGQGVGNQLLDAIVTNARANNRLPVHGVVNPENLTGDRVIRWLVKQGFVSVLGHQVSAANLVAMHGRDMAVELVLL